MDEKIDEIYYGSRNVDFQYLIRKILKYAKIKDQYVNTLLDEDGLNQYNIAFTSSCVNDINNYEIYEQLGDLSANKFIVSYMYNKFPKLLESSEYVKIVARIRILYGSKQTFSKIAEELGFWDFISSSLDTRNTAKKKLLEDVFEAFIGVTENMIDRKFKIGVGYAVVYDILSHIFDGIDISFKYEDLYDAKTRLKELFDYYKKIGQPLGTLKYDTVRTPTHSGDHFMQNTTVFQIIDNKQYDIGYGQASNKGDSEQNASANALFNLARNGYTKDVPELYLELEKEYNK